MLSPWIGIRPMGLTPYALTLLAKSQLQPNNSFPRNLRYADIRGHYQPVRAPDLRTCGASSGETSVVFLRSHRQC